jgi:hypothetical protein
LNDIVVCIKSNPRIREHVRIDIDGDLVRHVSTPERGRELRRGLAHCQVR